MKRILIVVVVFVLLLVVAPWGIGKLAESRVNASLDQLIEAAPYLSIAERKYTAGWFRSEQELTFEVMGPWLRALSSTSAEDAMRAAVTPDPAPPTPEAEAAQESVPAPHDDPPQIAMPVAAPPRFTVRNEILHGPVLWFSGFGIARVNSRVVLGETLRQQLIDAVGTDEPLRVSTRIGFFGGRTTTLTSEKRTVKLEKGETELSWDDLEVSASYSDDLDSLDITGSWPRVALRSLKGGPEGGEITDLSMDGSSERLEGDLYDTDFVLGFEKMKLVDAAGKTLEVDDGRYEVETSVDGDFVSIALKLGSGATKGQGLEMLGSDVQAVHYDFTFRRLQTKTMAALMTAIKDSYTKPPVPGVSAEIAAYGPIKVQVMELFKHDPEFAIDRIGLSTKEGDAYLQGVLRCRGVDEKDLEVGGLGLIAKLEADLKFQAPQALVEKIEGGTSWVSQMVEQGVLVQQGDKLVSHIEFAGGQLKVNGKVQAIPGLGAPPPSEPVAPE